MAKEKTLDEIENEKNAATGKLIKQMRELVKDIPDEISGPATTILLVELSVKYSKSMTQLFECIKTVYPAVANGMDLAEM